MAEYVRELHAKIHRVEKLADVTTVLHEDITSLEACRRNLYTERKIERRKE